MIKKVIRQYGDIYLPMTRLRSCSQCYDLRLGSGSGAGEPCQRVCQGLFERSPYLYGKNLAGATCHRFVILIRQIELIIVNNANSSARCSFQESDAAGAR